MMVMLPSFSPRIDRTQFNRYLQSYRRWAYDQRKRGAPVTCWCLYLWLAGNRRDQNNAILRTQRKRMHRPEGSTSNEWQGWKQHRRHNGSLSFSEYLARRATLANKGQGARTDLVYGPQKPKESKPPKAPKVQKSAKRLNVQITAQNEPRPFPPFPRKQKKPVKALPFAAKQSSVAKDDGLRMEPASVVAKINRLLAAQGIGRS